MRRIWFFILLVAIALPVLAKERVYPGKVFYLDTLRVIASRPQTTIGTIQVEKVAPAPVESSVAQLLDGLPGTVLTVGTKGESNLRIRGFDKTEIKVMMDGRPLSSGYFGNLDLHLLSASDLESVQLIKGPVSPIYGFNAMGGVVNIVTRKPDNRSWMKLGTQVKRNNTSRYYASTSRSFENFDYWLSGSYNHTDGFMLPSKMKPVNDDVELQDTGGVRNNGKRTGYDTNGRFNYMLFDKLQIGINAGYSFMPDKQNPHSIYPNPDENYSRIRDWRRTYGTLNAVCPLGSLSLQTSLYADDYRDIYDAYVDKTYQAISWSSAIKNHTYGEKVEAVWLLSRAKTTFGQRAETQGYTRHGGSGYEDGWTTNHMNLFQAYAQSEYTLNPHWNMTMASSLTEINVPESGRSDFYWEPALSFYWKRNAVNVSLGYSHNVKYPNMHQLYSSSSGNPELEPEVADKTELSGGWVIPWGLGGARIDQTVFANKVRNLIDKEGDTYENFRKFFCWGTETNFHINPLSFLNLSAYFVVQRADPGWSDRLPGNTPLFSGGFANHLSLLENLQFEVNGDWKDASTDYDYGIAHAMPSYWLFGAKLGYSYERGDDGGTSWVAVIPWKRFTANVAVENIFDSYHEEEYGYPGSGIDFSINMEVELF